VLCLLLLLLWVGWYNYSPSILPSVICRTAFAFSPPRLFTTGACASRWYWLKDQSLGLGDEEPEEDDDASGLGELSIRRGLPRVWWCERKP